MENVKEFKEFLTIEFMDEHQAYGHYPFQIVSEKEGRLTMGTMILNNIVECYKIFHKTMKDGELAGKSIEELEKLLK